MAAVELSGGQEIQRGNEEADPSGAACRGKQKEVGIDARVKQGVEKAEEKGCAEDDAVLVGIQLSDRRDDAGVKYAENEGGYGKDKTGERAGGADVKEGAGGANWRTNQDECPEGSDEVREGNKKRVGRVNVMVAAGEEMAEFVGEEDG